MNDDARLDDERLEELLEHLMSLTPDERAAVLFGRRCPRTGPRVQEAWMRGGYGCHVTVDVVERRRSAGCSHGIHRPGRA